MATFVWNGSVDGDTTTAGNWTPAGPPEATDRVIFPAWATQAVDGNADFPAGSASGVGFASVIIEEGVTYNIGTRGLPLELWMDTASNTGLAIGGIGIYYLQPKDYESITITQAGSAPAEGRYAINLTDMLLDAAVAGSIDILCESNQSIGIAAEAADAGEVDSITVHGGDVTVGSGVTLNDGSAALPVTVHGGTVETNMPMTIAFQDGGSWSHMAGAVSTSLTVNGGTFNYRSAGTAAVVIVGENGTIDLSKDPTAREFSTCDLIAGATLLDPNETLVDTLTVDLNDCRVEDVTLNIGRNFRITKGSVA